jgi:hypothetical protein
MLFLRRSGVLLVALALAALALSRAFDGTSSSAPNPRPTFVTVQSAKPGRSVPFGFLGLSLEYPSVEAYAGDDPNALDPVFEQLVRNLASGQLPVLRIGGDSADRTWWPTPALARPPGVKFAITGRWLEVTRALAQSLDARLILGLNLEAGNRELAASESRALVNGIGPGPIRALELGNEPDLYASFPWYRTPSGVRVHGRPPNYDMSGLIDDFTRFAAALPRLPLAGPSLGAPGWTRGLGRFLAAERRVGLVTLHRYPLQLCFIPRGSSRYPTVAHLLSPASSIGLADSFAPYVRAAAAHGLKLRIDELNSVACGADPAVSQTFASALWALNTLFEMVRVGIHGVNVHTFPGAGYQLFKVDRSGGRWQAVVGPEYYGLLMFTRAAPAGSRLLAVENADSGTVRIWATGAGGTIRVLAVNTANHARLLSLRVAGAQPGSALVQRLVAPSVRARTGATLAGQSFGSPTFTGSLDGTAQTAPVAPVNGRYPVWLPAGSAALLVLSPQAAGSG